MDSSSPFAISAAGMDVERMRLDVAALNLANEHVAQTKNGVGYSPLRVVVTGSSTASFSAQFEQFVRPPTVSVVPQSVPPRQVLEPGHPMADQDGLVHYPSIDRTVEMMNMLSATRSYEANVAAMNMSRTMLLKALEIGGAQ